MPPWLYRSAPLCIPPCWGLEHRSGNIKERMINSYDIAYASALGVSAPYWLLQSSARKKVLQAFSQRMGKVEPRNLLHPAIMIHAVSVGEINATRALVDALRAARPGL